MSATAHPRKVDVLLVGGGPTALITAYLLLKAGLSVNVIERYNKAEQAMYGRACMLYSRSVELLDQIGIFDRIADIGYFVRDSTTFKDGIEIPARGWSFVREAAKGKTYFDFSFSIRQKHIEDTLRAAIAEMDPTAVHAPAILTALAVVTSNDHPIQATVEENESASVVQCKYIIGADGGRSTVRSLSQIAFPGTESKHRWVRLDAVVRSDIPIGRKQSAAIESHEYGNVLWTPTDNGRTRIGFVLRDEVYDTLGGNITAEVIESEARKAVHPFSLEFVQLDWWTVYKIGQRVADTFKQGPVFLAGDAAHTHSSGAAQGMNTGIHDAINLAWKLAGVLRGWLSEAVLETYDAERRTSAQHLIQLDRDVAALISGKIPDHFNAPLGADVNVYLDRVFTENASFTIGLGISYADNVLNKTNSINVHSPMDALIGHRAPDVILYRPGPAIPRRMQELTRYVGRFWILIFAGALKSSPANVCLSASCAEEYANLTRYIASDVSFACTLAPMFSFLTIVHGSGALQSAEALGTKPLGKTAYDPTGEAYAKYSVEPSEGAIVIVRPDGIVGFRASLDGGSDVTDYFSAFLKPAKAGTDREQSAMTCVLGEISLEDQENDVMIPTQGELNASHASFAALTGVNVVSRSWEVSDVALLVAFVDNDTWLSICVIMPDCSPHAKRVG
ncbi:hypothetical protein IEO21_08138 [Rhodonia placenta]|uniref:FAD-binding domain-containing protein n=1 Tax=Rhodonia placenta TaxID=104341 RepID=A0A8H7NWU5_9APHY|nr:hypothetical protein IEO21_08138 [Postia placenta]